MFQSLIHRQKVAVVRKTVAQGDSHRDHRGVHEDVGVEHCQLLLGKLIVFTSHKDLDLI